MEELGQKGVDYLDTTVELDDFLPAKENPQSEQHKTDSTIVLGDVADKLADRDNTSAK